MLLGHPDQHFNIHKPHITCTTVYTKVEADIDVFWFDFDVKPGSFLKPIWHQKTIGFWYGFGMVLVWFWYGFGMVLVWFWYGFGMVLVWFKPEPKPNGYMYSRM